MEAHYDTISQVIDKVTTNFGGCVNINLEQVFLSLFNTARFQVYRSRGAHKLIRDISSLTSSCRVPTMCVRHAQGGAVVRLFMFTILSYVWVCSSVASASIAMGSQARQTPVLRKYTSPSLRLESIIVEVNGERRRVDPAAGFSVVRGDLVTVIDGWLLDKSKSIPLIDLVGFTPKLKKTPKVIAERLLIQILI